jgi:hypothetical protein
MKRKEMVSILAQTFLLCSKSFKPTLEALLVWISSPILGASAHWNVVGCSADGILATGVCFTGINTVVFYAGLVTWTLIVMLTFPSFDF